MTVESAHASLKAFLRDAKKDIDFIVNAFLLRHVEKGQIPRHIYGAIVEAWRELNPSFEEAIPRIDEIDRKDLDRVGLFGVQLYVKMQIYKNISEKFRRTLRPLLARRLFRILTAIKDSLCPLIGCLLEPVDEFLDAIDAILP